MMKANNLVEKVQVLDPSILGALCFSDFHADLFSEFAQPTDSATVNTRFKDQLETLQAILYTAQQTKQPVIFTGDLFHKRVTVNTIVFNGVYEVFRSYSDVPVLLLRGNHDSVNNSLYSPSALQPFEALPNVTVVERPQVLDFQGISVVALPYGHEIDEMKEFVKNAPPSDLLIAHIGVEGAKEGSGHSLAGAFTTSDLYPEKFNHVVLGHYHKRQYMHENIYYVGNTIPKDFSDTEEKGILVLNPKKRHRPEFCAVDNPLFITVDMNNQEITEELQEKLATNYVRLQGDSTSISKVVAFDDVPPNIRAEVKQDYDTESRIGIKVGESPQDVVKAYCDTFMKESTDTVLSYIERAIKEGE